MHSKANPFLATIKERVLLSKAGTQRRTYHIVLDLKGSGFRYNPGDSLGIFASNDTEVVEKTLRAMKAAEDMPVFERNGQESMRLYDFLTHKANIGQFSRKLVEEIAQLHSPGEKQEKLYSLLEDTNHEALKAYQEQHHLWDLLEEHSEVTFTPQHLCSLLMPLLPRLYSIASAQEVVGEEVHLTVSHLIYHVHNEERQGVCTSYLCQRAPLHVPCVPVYLQPHHGFTLPEDPDADMIMVGPGTGIAPFRAFMQKRIHQKAAGRNWLFFGEWQREYDFFYEDFWTSIPALRVETAFSRDQDYKIYVQHRMEEQAQELYQWIQNGAYLYVCGDAKHMAKDVDAALQKIIEHCTGCPRDSARAALKKLRLDKRYLRDIY